MNYLELVRRLALESGTELQVRIESVAITPATSYGTTTEHVHQLITWVQQSWLELQMAPDLPGWRFMRERAIIDLSEGITSYDIRQAVQDLPANDGEDVYDDIIPWVASIDRRYIWVYDSNVAPPSKMPCYYTPPEHFFGDRDKILPVPKGAPREYSFDPDGCIVFHPAPPTAGWQAEFVYRRVPQMLEADEDVPTGLKNKYHMVIVYRALRDYAGFEESSPQYQRSERLYKSLNRRLRMQELDEYTYPGTR